jgi:hypothetical protein
MQKKKRGGQRQRWKRAGAGCDFLGGGREIGEEGEREAERKMEKEAVAAGFFNTN